jgi:hypothetical protein
MAQIVNLETNEVVFEADDPGTIRKEADRLGKAWHDKHKGPLPYAVHGFDSTELETGEARTYEPPEPPPDDDDRIVVDEGADTLTVYGDGPPPVLPEDSELEIQRLP